MPKNLKGLCADMDGIVQWNDCCCVSLSTITFRVGDKQKNHVKTRDIIASCFSRFMFYCRDLFLRVT